MKRAILTLVAILIALPLYAQNSKESFFERAQREFNEFKKKSNEEFDSFRKKANDDYAEFLKNAWREFGVEEPVAPPKIDPPVQPVAPPAPPRQADKPVSPRPLVFKDVKPMDAPKVTPVPKLEIPEVTPEEEPFMLPMPVNFFGATCTVRLKPGAGEVKLTSVSNETISNAWKELSDGRFDIMFADCIAARESLKLCDWGYFQLAKRVAEEFCEAKNSNNSKILQAFLMTQAGYKIRMAREGNKLYLLFPSQAQISGKPFLRLDNTNFYILDEDGFTAKRISVCDAAFPGEQGFSFDIPMLPELPYVPSVERFHKSTRYPDANIAFAPNKNLINFFNTFPQVSWEIFAHGSLSQHTKDTIYPRLRKAIEGKGEASAANILINFIQTGFKYKVDQEQFGYERSLFGDETLFYEFCDCEDRAILYSILVRDLLGLKVALIHYPGHLATAVCFKDVYGDYLEVGGEKYTICDPTFINASIGLTMTGMKNEEAQVILL
ncbi:MAG: hypothetical protein IIU64_02370 [Alistipes sp.]|nr:hypothetical protein [Alistipes sp.]